MASTYSTNLALELMGLGDQSGSWGTTTNTNLGTLIEQAISGYVTQAITDGSGANTTITIPNGTTGVARNMAIEMTGALTFATCSLIVPANKKLYFIYNNTTGGQPVTVKVSGLTGVSVPNGAKVVLVCNGTDIVSATNYMASLTLGSALPVASGGTGITALGTGVATALGVNVGSAGAVVVNGGALGTPSSGVATNLTGTASGLTAGTASAVAVGGITGLGTGVATALAVNVGTAGAPVVNGGALGTPSSGVATNLTGTASGLTAGTASAVAVGGITGLGTGVGTALAVNVGSAGAPVLFNGAGGTPSSMTATNLTGTASGLTAGTASAVAVGGITGLGTGVGTALAVNVGSAGAPVVNGGALGTPSSGVATNLTGTASGLTAGAASAVALGGITGLGTGVGTALAIAVGSAGAPVLLNGAGGTPSSMTATNLTGTAAGLTAGAASAVALGGVTGLGTGVGTALAIAVGSAGALVTNGGALGTPSSGNGANLTSLTAANISAGTAGISISGNAATATTAGTCTGNAATVTTNANLTGHVTSVGNAAVLGSFSSAQLATALTDETGSGSAVFAASPTLSGTVGGSFTFSGIINETAKPAFFAYDTSAHNSVTGNGATVTVIVGTEAFDQGGNFASNTFTAPVAGKYRFSAVVNVTSASSADIATLTIVTTTRTYRTKQLIDGVNWGEGTVNLDCLADMAVNDTAYVQLKVNGEAGNTVGYAGSSAASLNTYFCGELVC